MVRCERCPEPAYESVLLHECMKIYVTAKVEHTGLDCTMHGHSTTFGACQQRCQ